MAMNGKDRIQTTFSVGAWLASVGRRVHLCRAFYYVVAPFLASSKKPCRQSSDKGLALLRSLHPDKGRSCVRESGIELGGASECDVHVIVAAYNAAGTLRRCMESVLSQQTRFSYHLTVVNDGSTDGTSEVLSAYSGNPLISIISQENRGLAGARNAAIGTQSSRYVMFLDADDALPSTAVESLISVAIDEDADVVEGQFCTTHLDGRTVIGRTRSEVSGFPCGKAIRTSLFGEVCFPEGYLYEDTFMSFVLLPRAWKKVVVPDVVYNYFLSERSITVWNEGKPRSIDGLWVMLRLIADRENLGMKPDCALASSIVRCAKLEIPRLVPLGSEVARAYMAVVGDVLNTLCPGLHCCGRIRSLECSLRSGHYFRAVLAAELL